MKKFFVKSFSLLKDSYAEFSSNNGVKLSAALSYYTIFSLAPLLLIIIYLAGLFWGTEAVQGQIFGQINGMIGKESAKQIQEMIKGVKLSGSGPIALIIGIATLISGAIGVFGEMQDSMNMIWKLKAKPKRGWVQIVHSRVISFSMIMVLAFLLMVSLFVNALVEGLGNRLQQMFPDIAIIIFYILNLIILFFIVALLFGMIFHFLPDGKIFWKDTVIGSLFTSLLFMIGKFAIGFYLGNSQVASGYGAAGSLIVILLWVYYSAIILYFGASFTKVNAYLYGKKIVPNKYAVFVEEKKIEKE